MPARARSPGRPLAAGLLVPAALALTACRSPESGAPRRVEQPPASTASQVPPQPPPGAGERQHPLPLQDLAPAEIADVRTPWFGDLDPLRSTHRRFLRVVVPVSRTLYFTDGPAQHGIAYDALLEYEKTLAGRAAPGVVPPQIVIIPVARDRLLAALQAGQAEIAIGGFSVLEARSQAVAFTHPTLTGVYHVVVASKDQPPLAALDDLSGREVHVRRSSGYHEDLMRLNERLGKAGRAPVTIVDIDEALEDEDILQMVDAGIVPFTITNTLYASFWRQVYDRLRVYDRLEVHRDGTIAWACRREARQLLGVTNAFVDAHKAGTIFGNLLITRYLGSAARLRNPGAAEDLRRFRSTAGIFQKYGRQYQFDWLVIAAQAYQASGLDQSLKGPGGAQGIMQITPAAAGEVGFRDVTTVDDNIHAGVKYLRFLADRYYADERMDRLNKALFAFASYNAGPARVQRLRAKAEALGLSPNVWFNNVEVVASREIGRETVDYVSNVYKYYTAFKAIAARQDRQESRAGSPPASLPTGGRP
jgi:membrane-bound lytic murein transglycosylase MltF